MLLFLFLRVKPTEITKTLSFSYVTFPKQQTSGFQPDSIDAAPAVVTRDLLSERVNRGLSVIF